MSESASPVVAKRTVTAHVLSQLALLLAVFGTIALCRRYSKAYYGNVVDDALTSMQYAKNLALGHGVVFNVGERVEGYTNFLWVLFMAPLYAAAGAASAFVKLIVVVNIGIA